MKCRGVAKGLLRLFHASCCKLLRCIPTPCFGFTVSQPFQDTKMFIKTSHSIENIEIHRNPWVTSRSARIVSKSWVNPMGHDASRALWEGITNWFRLLHLLPLPYLRIQGQKMPKYCQFFTFLFRIFKTADCHCTSMIAFAQFRLPLSIAQYLNGPVLSSPVPFDRNMSELSYWIPALYGIRTYALSEGFRSLLLVNPC